MKDFASFLMISTLCVAACASDNGPAASVGGVTSTAGSTAPAGPAAGGSAQVSMSNGGRTASGTAGASTAPSTAPRAGMGAVAAGGSGGAATPATGMAAAAGSGGSGGSPAASGAAPMGSFQAAYNMALKEMCVGCHTPDALIGSPNLSTIDKAYETLMDKDATMMAPGQCAGMGKLVTPGNCETSLLYNKIAEDMPKCGRHMPLGSDTMPTRLPPAALEAVCAWIKAGAKKD